MTPIINVWVWFWFLVRWRQAECSYVHSHTPRNISEEPDPKTNTDTSFSFSLVYAWGQDKFMPALEDKEGMLATGKSDDKHKKCECQDACSFSVGCNTVKTLRAEWQMSASRSEASGWRVVVGIWQSGR
jgi:hypothetical protein